MDLAISTENLLIGILGPIFGSLIIWAACSNWNWYWEHRKARMLTSLIGKTGARVVYIIIGVVLIIGGLSALFQQP